MASNPAKADGNRANSMEDRRKRLAGQESRLWAAFEPLKANRVLVGWPTRSAERQNFTKKGGLSGRFGAVKLRSLRVAHVVASHTNDAYSQNRLSHNGCIVGIWGTLGRIPDGTGRISRTQGSQTIRPCYPHHYRISLRDSGRTLRIFLYRNDRRGFDRGLM